mmetsp:Transcript_32882/g.85382  ORF Transcript_32882/g.85382 Transcript_32882/m.85382 type:complete len:130 (+) Transcript_32882:1924-2313(+)
MVRPERMAAASQQSTREFLRLAAVSHMPDCLPKGTQGPYQCHDPPTPSNWYGCRHLRGWNCHWRGSTSKVIADAERAATVEQWMNSRQFGDCRVFARRQVSRRALLDAVAAAALHHPRAEVLMAGQPQG